MTAAFIGLGGNLGDPERQMAGALRLLDAAPGVRVVSVSPIYRTPPWGLTGQPDFLNACAGIATDLGARAVLALCLDVEERLKRRRGERWGPRRIDLDLLVFGTSRVEEPGLSVPHPRMGERAFVLRPLADIAPELEVEGWRVADRLAALDGAGIALHRAGGEWWRADG